MKRFGLLLFCALWLGQSHSAFALTTEEKELQDLLHRADKEVHNSADSSSLLDGKNWAVVAKAIADEAPPPVAPCAETNKKLVNGSYVITSSNDGQLCKVYDLSFPTLATLFSHKPVSSVPVQRFHAGDYLAWLKGDYDSIQNKIEDFRVNMDQGNRELAGWVKNIRFRQGFVAASVVASTGLPTSFHASDLDTGAPLQFSHSEQESLKKAFRAVEKNPTAEQSEDWNQLVSQPNSLLAKIRFDWNDAGKVYDIFLEGQFLPIRGPIALVDYNASYKLAVERILRSVLHSALSKIIGFIPAPAGRLVSIAVDDAFSFIDMAYEYQINKFEGTFNSSPALLDAKQFERTMNVLAAGHADFVNLYLMSVIQGRPFSWTALEDAGRTIRYNTLTERDTLMSKLNSKMVLEQGCEMEIVHDYFGVCSKARSTKMYSMISESKILFWNLGGPIVHNFKLAPEVALRRGTAYLLSMGTRFFDLPFIGFLAGQLTATCKSMAFDGITDEGFLRASLNKMRDNGKFGPNEKELSKWLYIQNLNLFLPKSEQQEKAIVAANANLLGVAIQ